MTRMANRETSQFCVVRRLIQADVPEMVSIIETARREYGVQRRKQSVMEPLDLDLYTTCQAPRSDYFIATHAGVPAGEEGSRRSPGPQRLLADIGAGGERFRGS
jgi:hypothetical protein